MAAIEVEVRSTGDGWQAEVTVRDRGSETRHAVALTAADLQRLAPGAADPAALVHESFAFLLEREPKESILRSFALPVIGRYYPEYEAEIRRRVRG